MVARVARKFEVVNPLDPYSITSTSEIHAAAAVILLSEGRFALRMRYLGRPGRIVCPPFSLSGELGLEHWWRGRPEYRALDQKVPFFKWVESEKRGIADALETIKLEARMPTDEVDLVTMAKQLAKELRRKIEKEALR